MVRFFPQPILSFVIALVWVLLVNDVSAGAVAFGITLGWAIPKLTSRYWPSPPRIRRPVVIIEYMSIVLVDIAVSNVRVAYWVLFRRGGSLKSRFISVPLDLTTAEAIAALAGTITMTPGTVSADLSADGRSLLVHCLETTDPDATVARIKERYERRLKEIFE
ncbi:Na+/H+ antiporter subunit E [Microvirga sp. KLBC 81]|uniref:Na+/H+ antiporter subunit E n=1 Tax=Microvirga sp. KLBC 81 TaxID=1862707 RepID=UPI000D5094E9|nr:Na+/H+ antiporter subunit E [Microvirga sp. KLBC 81]PVE25457.1 Na+/H+ antiporter subunit E [Microvirga sp. KLBC 81]